MDQARCPTCNGVIPPNAPAGHCPRCLLDRVVRGSTQSASFSEADAGGCEACDAELASTTLGKFGEYELLEEIARGGMGIVYRARQLSPGRIVALKTILAGQFANAAELARFKSEAEAAASLDHPNIVPLYDVGEHDGRQFFTMKFVEGGSLATRISTLVRDPEASAKLLRDLALAIHYAHLRGILHRDLKPANILFDSNATPHISDFGLAKRVEGGDDATKTGVIVGTPTYMSPEQASGKCKRLTTASDIYSLGVILYEMLTGRAPFAGESAVAVLLKVRNDEPVAPRKIVPGVERDLEVIALKCMQKEPAKRYGSAEALAADLDRWLRGEPILARATTTGERVIKWAKRRPAAAMSAVLSVALAGAIVGAIWHNGSVKRQAEVQKIAERARRADTSAGAGAESLALAAKAGDLGDTAACQKHLIAAQDNFRAGLIESPSHPASQKGLREAALRHFELALDERNWRQAHEKLDLAQMAGLDEAAYQKNLSTLKQFESQRTDYIQKRVEELFFDAPKTDRKISHEFAANELISMKDPVAAELLMAHLDDKNPNKRKLAIAALTWYGDKRAVPLILHNIQERREVHYQPPDIQEAAICALCVLAGDDDVNTFVKVRERLLREPGKMTSLLAQRVRAYYEPYAARMTARAGEPAGALETYSVEQWHDLGVANLEGRRWAAAIEYFDKALMLDPAHTLSLGDRANAKRGMGDISGALADYDSLIRNDPRLISANLDRSLAKIAKGDLKGALADCDAALAIDPENAQAFSHRGRAKIELCDYAGAISDLTRALDRSPALADACVWRGHARSKRNDLAGAAADCDRAVELNPRAVDAYLERCHIRLLRSDWRGALADVNKALELQANNAYALALRARVKRGIGDLKGATNDCVRSYELDSKCAYLYFVRAEIKIDRALHSEALVELNKALRHKPRDPDVLYTRAVLREKTGDYDSAVADYTDALDANPGLVDAYVRRGIILKNNGDRNNALFNFNKALELNPEHGQALQLMQELRPK